MLEKYTMLTQHCANPKWPFVAKIVDEKGNLIQLAQGETAERDCTKYFIESQETLVGAQNFTYNTETHEITN